MKFIGIKEELEALEREYKRDSRFDERLIEIARDNHSHVLINEDIIVE